MKRRNETGIAHLGVIIAAILVVAAVVLGGWYVWENNKQNEARSNGTSSQSQSDSKQQTENKVTIPEGWKLYKNNEAGFSFYYPPEWGEVKKLETAYKFSELSGPTFEVHERTLQASSMEFGNITPLVTNVYVKDDKPVVELAPGFTTVRQFTAASIIKNLAGNRICLVDEYDPIDYGVDPETTVYFRNGYCGLNSKVYGSFVFQGYIRDRNDPAVPKLKEEITKLLQTFEIF